jgi:8-oxo-dGTP diphosphatase
VQEWLVGGAVIEGPDGILLVRNRRRGGEVDWSPAGGVIDAGESMLEGLGREVAEETGLRVTAWTGPLYAVVAEAPGLGWRMRAEIHLAASYEGDLVLEDPDGIVEEASFFPASSCRSCLEAGHRWVREPLLEWLDERWDAHREFTYLVEGADRRSLVITRM